MIDIINELISKLTNYGVRICLITSKHFSIINWSNGSEDWYLTSQDWLVNYKQGQLINLDANQLLVPYKHSEVSKILEQLNALPLYINSFEYGQRLREKYVNQGVL